MKKLLLLWLMCVMSTVCTVAQRTYTFKAGMLNVDGLPEFINEGAALENGSRIASEYIANSGWDIVAFAEDFNFHDALISSAQTYYNFGQHTGTITASAIFRANCDGLGIACSKWLTFPGAGTVGTRVNWTASNGWLTN